MGTDSSREAATGAARRRALAAAAATKREGEREKGKTCERASVRAKPHRCCCRCTSAWDASILFPLPLSLSPLMSQIYKPPSNVVFLHKKRKSECERARASGVLPPLLAFLAAAFFLRRCFRRRCASATAAVDAADAATLRFGFAVFVLVVVRRFSLRHCATACRKEKRLLSPPPLFPQQEQQQINQPTGPSQEREMKKREMFQLFFSFSAGVRFFYLFLQNKHKREREKKIKITLGREPAASAAAPPSPCPQSSLPPAARSSKAPASSCPPSCPRPST